MGKPPHINYLPFLFHIENNHNHKTSAHKLFKQTGITGDMLSVTMLSGYMYCPRKLYLERVLGLCEPPKEALVRGSIRHQTYDLINKNEERIIKSITKPGLIEIKEKYRNEYMKFLRVAVLNNKEALKQFSLKPEEAFNQASVFIMDEAETRSLNVFNFIEKHNVLGEELWEKFYPKVQSEIKIASEKLGLTGIVDQVEIYPEGIVPIELKTGKAPVEGAWPGHKIQIAAYALLLEEFYSREIKEGFITYLDSKERRRIPMNAFLRMEIIELIKSVNLLLSSKEIPECAKSQSKCAVCGLKEDCFNEKKLFTMLK